MTPQNILILGGSGFIGTRLVAKLLEQGHTLRIADKRPSERYPELWMNCDIRNIDDVRKACEGVTVIYNLAAEHTDNVKPISLYYDVNVEGTRHVCQVASELQIRKIIFTSSVAVYGLNSDNTDELGATEPFNDYGKSKLEAEKVLEEWAQLDAQRSLTIVRPTVVFGAGNRGNVYNLIAQVVRGPFVMIGNGCNKKSMAYVENVAAFLVHSLTFGEGVQIYNYIDKPDFDMNTLVACIYKSRGQASKRFVRIPYAIGLLAGLIFDVLSKLTKKSFPISAIRIKKFTANSSFSADKALASGFVPPFHLEEALKKTIQGEFL